MTDCLDDLMKPFFAGSLVVAFLAGCAGAIDGSGPDGSQEKKSTPDRHTSQNALDWASSYEGVLPCADCPGIKTRLILNPDGRYELSTQYLDRQPAHWGGDQRHQPPGRIRCGVPGPHQTVGGPARRRVGHPFP